MKRESSVDLMSEKKVQNLKFFVRFRAQIPKKKHGRTQNNAVNFTLRKFRGSALHFKRGLAKNVIVIRWREVSVKMPQDIYIASADCEKP